MNFLGHAVLSFNHPAILTGNMISDFVKGKSKFEFPGHIQKGIQLHRQIDEFTDGHLATQQAKSFFRQDYRLYSAPIVDIVYDYFLANDKNEFKSEADLKLFTRKTYRSLGQYKKYFPAIFEGLFPYMKNQDWLYGYRFPEGIQKSLDGLSRRSNYMGSSEKAYHIFLKNTYGLQRCFDNFFPEIKEYVLKILENSGTE